MLDKNELNELKDLAEKAQPFYENESVDFDSREYKKRIRINADFFIAAKKWIPVLISKVIDNE
jgi:hypothetical protein